MERRGGRWQRRGEEKCSFGWLSCQRKLAERLAALWWTGGRQQKGKRRVKSSGKWRHIQCFCLAPTLPPYCWACQLWCGRGGEEGSEWGRQRVPPPLHTHWNTHTHTLYSLKQLSVGEGDNKRNNTDRKCPVFLACMGRWKGLSGYLCV